MIRAFSRLSALWGSPARAFIAIATATRRLATPANAIVVIYVPDGMSVELRRRRRGSGQYAPILRTPEGYGSTCPKSRFARG